MQSLLQLQLTLLISGKIQWRRCCISHLVGMQKKTFFLIGKHQFVKREGTHEARNVLVSFNFVKGFSIIQK